MSSRYLAMIVKCNDVYDYIYCGWITSWVYSKRYWLPQLVKLSWYWGETHTNRETFLWENYETAVALQNVRPVYRYNSTWVLPELEDQDGVGNLRYYYLHTISKSIDCVLAMEWMRNSWNKLWSESSQTSTPVKKYLKRCRRYHYSLVQPVLLTMLVL